MCLRIMKMDKKDLVDIDELEVVKKHGKTYVRMSSFPNLTKKKDDHTLPEDVKELLRNYIDKSI